jgi:UDP-3-O-[3-hydroxymyristoyl] glucosamine N-acyltransferase
MAQTLGTLAEHLGARLVGDAEIQITRVASLDQAQTGCLSFFSNTRYSSQLQSTRAEAVIVDEKSLPQCPTAALVVDNPYLGYALAAAILHPLPEFTVGIHPQAIVSPEARIDPQSWVGPGTVIEAGVRVARGVYIGPNCVLGEQVCIGINTRLSASVSICQAVIIGERCIVHPGAVIGADGFGIANDNGVWVKVPQLGTVIIGNDVEIGANTTIDRGALEDTIIGNGVKLDNLIQIAHAVTIGEHTAIASGTGIAGSSRIGARCTIGGAVSIAGHLEICDDVHLTATSAVPRSITKPGVYSSGMPIQETPKWRRNVIRMAQLDDMAQRLKQVEKQLKNFDPQ